MAGGGPHPVCRSVCLPASGSPPSPRRGSATPGASQLPASRAPQVARRGGPRGPGPGHAAGRAERGACGEQKTGGGGEGRREAREAGRARREPALVGGCEQVAVGVCRACQQLCQERLARARAQEAGSCQPPARAVRRVRTPPNRGSHRLLPHPHQPSGLGIPGGQRRRREPSWSRLRGESRGSPFHAQPLLSPAVAGPSSWPLDQSLRSSPYST